MLAHYALHLLIFDIIFKWLLSFYYVATSYKLNQSIKSNSLGGQRKTLSFAHCLYKQDLSRLGCTLRLVHTLKS
jgi:hypothetical protein